MQKYIKKIKKKLKKTTDLIFVLQQYIEDVNCLLLDIESELENKPKKKKKKSNS